ncbi:hypothetical protein [Cronobacter phage ENT39118]|uniref:hypothetical protein n=1 Tax=Cronobacter phage ENT39118 TaxID=984175 RepID=UPI000201F57E|nr:hypothetical protein G186_gp16 [Cronobacter phage ENT39118]ADZ13605.1 hypothetical protein [Cronobacter phage ENT39118]
MIGQIEDAYILKPDGSRFGPYKAKFAGSTVIVNDPKADIADGDQVSRVLPNGKEEIKHIKTCSFYNHGIANQGAHFQLKVQPIAQAESYVKHQTFNISGANSNVQIGNHNQMEFRENVNYLLSAIEKAEGTPEEKAQAKGLLRKFLEHPLVTTIAGSAADALLS